MWYIHSTSPSLPSLCVSLVSLLAPKDFHLAIAEAIVERKADVSAWLGSLSWSRAKRNEKGLQTAAAMDPQLHPASRHTPPQSTSINPDRSSRAFIDPHLEQQHHQQLQRNHPGSSYPSASTYPQQYLQPPPPLDSDNHLTATVGRFTEEWDAIKRGSSIIDGPATTPNPPADMQRSNSIHSYSVGDDQQLALARGNTLKKKASMRRTGSLRRSSSRRSNRAGSVRSLAIRSSSDPDHISSAFYCPVPTSGTPTDVLAGRFQSTPPHAHWAMLPPAPPFFSS